MAETRQGSLQDGDILQNLLNDAKYMAGTLNQYILEASNEDLRRDYMTVLGEVYAQQKQVYDIMEQKGFYNPKRAQKQDVTQVENKFKQNQQSQSDQTQETQ
jgi:spore coat protein CotF